MELGSYPAKNVPQFPAALLHPELSPRMMTSCFEHWNDHNNAFTHTILPLEQFGITHLDGLWVILNASISDDVYNRGQI